MAQALTRYQVLYESMTSRRRRPTLPRGLDVLATIAKTACAITIAMILSVAAFWN